MDDFCREKYGNVFVHLQRISISFKMNNLRFFKVTFGLSILFEIHKIHLKTRFLK